MLKETVSYFAYGDAVVAMFSGKSGAGNRNEDMAFRRLKYILKQLLTEQL